MTSLVGLRKGIAYGNNASLRERLLALFLEIGDGGSAEGAEGHRDKPANLAD